MPNQLRFILNRLRERLWVKPLIACVVSIAGVLLAHVADNVAFDWKVPEVAHGSLIDMFKLIAASMLGVATFAVASMVSAYGATGQSATARAFPLVVADDVSQNALSVFIAAFIFAIVALTASSNGYYGKAGRFTLFLLTMLVLAVVVVVFVRWVDSIARLGRLGAVIDKAEQATAAALAARRLQPCLGGMALTGPSMGIALCSEQNGYLQRVDMAALQRLAASGGFHVALLVTPGALVVASRPLALITADAGQLKPIDHAALRKAFIIGALRQFDDDPRFGVVVLAEIASRALSPGINDPGTAIAVLSSLQRLFAAWDASDGPDAEAPLYDRIAVPPLAVGDLFDDAFPAIARDSAGMVEVAERVQRILGELGHGSGSHLRGAARRHAALAMARAERALDFPPDRQQVRRRHADYWPLADGVGQHMTQRGRAAAVAER